jgi:hypothetical protein
MQQPEPLLVRNDTRQQWMADGLSFSCQRPSLSLVDRDVPANHQRGHVGQDGMVANAMSARSSFHQEPIMIRFLTSLFARQPRRRRSVVPVAAQIETLEARRCLSAGSTLSTLAETADYSLKMNDTGRVAVMELVSTEYEAWRLGNQSYEQTQALTQRIYNEFPDAFDFIFVVNNESQIHAGANYYGLHTSVKNDTLGLGMSQFDLTANFGSDDKLQGVMHLIDRSTLTGGPSLHELMHRWGNYLTDVDGSMGGHWGFSSVGGQLGGWKAGTLRDLGGGLYDVDGPRGSSFGTFANGGNGLPYGQLELYLMGMIGADELTDPIQVAVNPTFEGEGTNPGQGIFRASSIKTLSIQDIIRTEGERTPSVATSQKSFRALTVLVTPTMVTQEQLDQMDTSVELFSTPGDDGWWSYNFWEATGGRASLKMDGLVSLTADPPTIDIDSASRAITINENSPAVEIQFDVSDPQTPVSGLVVTASSSNGQLIPESGLVVAGIGASRTITITPTADRFGTATITLTARNSAGATDTDTITVHVEPRADMPSITSSVTTRNRTTQSGLVIARNANDGAEVTHFEISGISGGRLYLSNEITEVADGNSVTTEQAGAGLRFAPSAGFVGTATFLVRAATGDSDADVSGEPAAASILVSPGPIARMYRAYNPIANFHFFTTHRAEFDNAVAHGYVDESTGLGGFAILTSPTDHASPLFRLYNLQQGFHYYTLDAAEKAHLLSLNPPPSDPIAGQVGWRDEGVEGYLYSVTDGRPVEPGTKSLFRLYNQDSGTHLLTDNPTVREAVLGIASSATGRHPWARHADVGQIYQIDADWLADSPTEEVSADSNGNSSAEVAVSDSTTPSPSTTVPRILLQDSFDSGVASPLWGEIYRGRNANEPTLTIEQNYVDDSAARIRYRHDEDNGMLLSYNQNFDDGVYVRFWQMYPTGVSTLPDAAGLKQLRFFLNPTQDGRNPYQFEIHTTPDGPSFGAFIADANSETHVESPFPIVPGEWFKLGVYIKHNTPGQANGILRVWRDDALIIERTNVVYRTTTDNGANSLMIGGNVSTNGRTFAEFDRYIDDVLIATSPDGDILRQAPETQLNAMAIFRFEGNAENEGTGRVAADLRNTAFQNGSLSLNGKYEFSGDPEGFRALFRTPDLDYRAFTVGVRFKAEESTAVDWRCILTAGMGWRWFGLERSPDGSLAVFFNNYSQYFPIPDVQLRAGEWIDLACSVDLVHKRCEVFVNGQHVKSLDLPSNFVLDVMNSDFRDVEKHFAFTTYCPGIAFHGLVDQLVVHNRVLLPNEIPGIFGRLCGANVLSS